ncbi:hypothetical protein SCP_0701320 [Sparassis crispa]|uniref:Large ribosomal subunit protein uL29m n=1 Tax=Sparassis crispa TaxID=139825 RepID=A0A401GS15_9APHY|nr:hypothetical protein SCP_0701320 [Sparassis crispa]GBE84950.1 hypothetical protein SCP_0701320 [Sparassis crispa]
MLPSIQARTFSPLLSFVLRPRTLATHATAVPTTYPGTPPVQAHSKKAAVSSASTNEGGALRPHLNIPVNPNHGLYGFFRRTEKDGVVSYETVEQNNALTTNTGRSWTAAELRLKSFKDLHTLWYVLLRERNLLASQAEEARRHGITVGVLNVKQKSLRCRKSMARIKYVINERRLAYEGAVGALREQREKELAALREERVAEERAEAAAAQAAAKAADKESRQDAGQAQSAANLAAQGLFETAPQNEGQAKRP